jgi:hypothetical protein
LLSPLRLDLNVTILRRFPLTRFGLNWAGIPQQSPSSRIPGKVSGTSGIFPSKKFSA